MSGYIQGKLFPDDFVSPPSNNILLGIPQERQNFTVEPYKAPDGTTWVSLGAYEQNIKLQKATYRIQELELELALLKGKNLVSSHISGEFSTQDVHKSLDFWPSSSVTYPMKATVIDSICSFCGNKAPVLEIDSSHGEYDFLSICQPCISDVFVAVYRESKK